MRIEFRGVYYIVKQSNNIPMSRTGQHSLHKKHADRHRDSGVSYLYNCLWYLSIFYNTIIISTLPLPGTNDSLEHFLYSVSVFSIPFLKCGRKFWPYKTYIVIIKTNTNASYIISVCIFRTSERKRREQSSCCCPVVLLPPLVGWL